MKFAAIADVHGNCIALEAVLADIDFLGITEVVNLGDHLSEPLEARRTADLLIERSIPSIQGDQDRLLIELDRAGTSNRQDYKQLTRAHLDWLADQPPTMICHDDVLLCHGTPRERNLPLCAVRPYVDGRIGENKWITDLGKCSGHWLD